MSSEMLGSEFDSAASGVLISEYDSAVSEGLSVRICGWENH